MQPHRETRRSLTRSPMNTFRTTMTALLAAVAALPLNLGQAEAGDGRNAALFGGAALGVLAGAAISDAANADTRGYQQADWWNGGDGYARDNSYGYRDNYERPRYTVRRYDSPSYVYVVPAPRYREEYRSDWRWQR